MGVPAAITTPRQRIDAECAVRGRAAVVAGCADLLAGREVEPALLMALGGPRAERYAHGGAAPDYWPRVWAARGLLWAWDDAARPALLTALRDEAWRVRELAAKAAARHAVDTALPLLLDLRHDPVPRVRAAAARAVALLTTAASRRPRR